jgi:ABC-type transporter Mla MlaB component
MLKITVEAADGKTVALLLDGQVAGPWVKLLRSTCETQLLQGAEVVIDLRNVCFADRDGIALLQELVDCEIEILNALPFIAVQIRKVTP